MSVIGKMSSAFPSKGELLASQLIKKGERVRVEYSGKSLAQNTKIQQLVEDLGLQKPSVTVGVNGRGDSAVAGIVVKDGKDVVLRAAGGVDYTFGEKPLVQIRGRIADGKPARLNMIADLNKSVDAENMAVNMSNKGGKLDISLDSDKVKGNFSADMNSKEMKNPKIKYGYDKLMKTATKFINDNKAVTIMSENAAETLNSIRHPFKNFHKEPIKVSKENLKPKEFSDDIRKAAEELRAKGDKIRDEKKLAYQKKFQQQLDDEDCEFIARKAKELGTTVFDPKILEDPEIIKRFGLQ